LAIAAPLTRLLTAATDESKVKKVVAVLEEEGSRGLKSHLYVRYIEDDLDILD
jgi:hypothetical protein